MRRRTGFTITELLVSMALIVFIMSILAEAFTEGLKTFRALKAVGDLNARLRTAASTLRDDLSVDHFEAKRRLSDPTFWAQGPPQEGCFRLWHGSSLAAAGAGSFYSEGNPDGIDSFYATDQSLEFTVKKRGNNRQDFYSATVPAGSPLLTLGTPDSRYQDTANVYNSQWAEIAWFLRANGATSGTLPLFTLYRRQRVVVPSTIVPGANGTTVDLNYQAPGALALNAKSGYLEVSTSISSQNTLYFNSPRDLTIPQRRFGMDANGLPNKVAAGGIASGYLYPIFAAPTSPNYLAIDDVSTLEGTDVILTDVISFSVLPLFNGSLTADFPSQNNRFPAGVSVFDTWSSNADNQYDYSAWNNDPTTQTVPPFPSILTGLQISIRVWDAKQKLTRQLTIMQDL